MGTIVSFLILLLISIYLYFRIVRSYYASRLQCDETHYCTTRDGWHLALHRYTTHSSSDRSVPILLLHGLGSSATGFDLGDHAPSLPVWLRDHGWDVWVPDLRGHGFSERPSFLSEKRYGWSFDDYLKGDLPALIDTILAKTGAAELHCVGHSMGGILGLSAAASTELKDRIASVVAVGSSLNYSKGDTAYQHWKRYLKPFRGLLPAVPANWLATLSAPVSGRFENSLDRFSVSLENMNPTHLRRLYARTFSPISTPVLLQLESVLEPSGLKSFDGATPYFEDLSRIDKPILLVAGEKDTQCPVEAVEATFEKLPSANRTLRKFDKMGHWDLLIGKHSEGTVFRTIEDFLSSPRPKL